MTFIKKILLISSFLGFFTIYAQKELHVATNGNNQTGTGTIENPYKTIQHAANLAEPGDLVLVHEGTYRNSQFGDNDIWEGDNLAKITANGSVGNYITFRPFKNNKVLLEFDHTYGILFSNASYIKFTGFEIKGIADNITKTEADEHWGIYKENDILKDLAVELGIDITDPSIVDQRFDKPSKPGIKKPSYYNGRGIVANKSHHIDITNNIIRDVPSSAIRAQQSDYINIVENEVYNNTYWTTLGVGAITVAEATVTPEGDTFTGEKIFIERNNVHHNENRMISWNPGKTFVNMVIDEGTGIFLTRNRDTYSHGYIRIANNLSYFNGASGIVCHFTNNTNIVHNTTYKNGTTNSSIPGGIGVNNVDDVLIANNIIYARPDKWAIGILAKPITNLVVENNIVYNENGSIAVNRNIDDGWDETDPLLVDPENNDFSIASNSPAIDSGSITLISDDIDKNLRNDGSPDIGAYEYSHSLSNDNFEIPHFNVYPNPTSDYININSNTEIKNIQLYNQLGQNIPIQKLANGGNSIQLNLSYIPKGIYFLKMGDFTKTIIKK